MRNIDLRRKTGYKPRKKEAAKSLGFQNQEYRQMRTYDDYMKALGKTFAEYEVVEMDTVKGVRGRGKRLLTMIFRKNSVMLLFLLPIVNDVTMNIECMYLLTLVFFFMDIHPGVELLCQIMVLFLAF